MKSLALVMLVAGSIGLACVALSIAADTHPLWMRTVKQLPDQASFSRNEVVAIIQSHVEHMRTRLLLGVAFAVVAMAGNSILAVRSRRASSRGSDGQRSC